MGTKRLVPNSYDLNLELHVGEERVVQALCAFLIRDKYRVKREVPNMGQSIDIVATRNRWVTAIEAKMSNWRRALEQCEAHELVADYICIAIATKTISPRFRNESVQKGYGIIRVDYNSGACFLEVKPKKNQRVWEAQRERLTANLRRISCEGRNYHGQ